jgi:hypothetical protein
MIPTGDNERLYDFGQVHCIFTITFNGMAYDLVYVRWYRSLKEQESPTGLTVVSLQDADTLVPSPVASISFRTLKMEGMIEGRGEHIS